MNKIILSAILLLLFPMVAMGQYANYQNTDVTSTKEYKIAQATFYSGLAVTGVGAAVWIGGSVLCMVEQNIYTNSHITTGTIEEIYKLNQEAKQQQAYKRCEAIEIGGFVVMLAGAGVAFLGQQKRNKLKCASGKTVAILEYGPTLNGLALALRF